MGNTGGSNEKNSLTISPGMKEAASVTMKPGLESQCYGTIASQADVRPDILIKKIIIKRKRLVSYEG